jgi:ADP-ribose pyrophosphatase YjhB (NUDIX family)
VSARAELLELAGWLDRQLDDENADRQIVAETALRRVQGLAAGMSSVGPAKLRELIAALLGTMRLQGGGGYYASGEMLASDRDRIASAVVLLLADVDRPDLGGPAVPVVEYTHPDVFTAGVADGWAEPEADPARIDWATRQAAAAIPFAVVGGRPVNPCARTGVQRGRNELGRWGENLMADALVTVTFGAARWLLLVERGDGYGWAVPGGAVEPGETGRAAALRELAEETGLSVAEGLASVLTARYVPDPRASDEAWAVTVPVHVDLGPLPGLPFVAGGDDARRAEWVRADTYEHLEAALSECYGGAVFAAHAVMLRDFLDGAL